MNNLLTVIIPVLNEGEELSNTLSEIRRTALNKVDIIVIDDASTDNYDYRAVANHYNAQYIRHYTRWGSGPSKQHGIDKTCTPYFIVLDAHMRFYDNIWWKETSACIEENPNAIYCMKCKPWSAETKEEMNIAIHGGAYIDILTDKPLDFFKLHWIKYKESTQRISPIPCVLGACYASSKTYWQQLRGFEGLCGYGSEEVFISLKSWMIGKGCYLMNRLTIGHLFRKDFPYVVGHGENILNKMLVADLLLPEAYKICVFNNVKRFSYTTYRKYMAHPAETTLKEYFSKTVSPESFKRFHSINLVAQGRI
ncbi:MAG: glycosyltransferase family 2 protein [Bacteroidales bacterium]|nr:glycosyltransferase family 2 protein [Bacteroidales bacterium]